ncbi:hypothetical protein QQ045_023572 [Rhodiola kirilowii]
MSAIDPDRRSDQEDDDDDFSDLYKEYTGPPVLNKSSQERPVMNKRSLSDSDAEEEDPDPNAVPTDFTSRDKKAWEAKAKATERNWKKRKEEEMICKLCGDSGHYTQGCPSTLGANGKEFFQRVAARDKHVRALFTEKLLADIEKEIGCKLRLDEKFLFVSSKDGLILAKGVDAVHKLINDDSSRNELSNFMSPRSKLPDTSATDSRIPQYESKKSFPSPRNASQSQPKYSGHEKAVKDRAREDPQKDICYPKTIRSKSSDRSSADVRLARTDSRKSNSSPRNFTQVQPRYNKDDKALEDSVRKDLHRMSKDSPQAYGSTGARGPSHSKSPPRHMQSGNSFNMHGSHNVDIAAFKTTDRDTGRLRSVITPPNKVEHLEFPRALEELELQFIKEATDLSDIRDKEEDEENHRHRESVWVVQNAILVTLPTASWNGNFIFVLASFLNGTIAVAMKIVFALFEMHLTIWLHGRKAIREIRESYFKKLSSLRSAHAKQWEEFLQLDAQRRKQQLDAQRQTERLDARPLTSGYDGGGSKQASFGKYGSGGANDHYTGSSYPIEANRRYTDPADNYVSSRVNHSFGEYQRWRRDDCGRNYNRY